MKYLITLLIGCVLGIGIYLIIPKSKLVVVGGAFGQPGIIDLGTASLASSSFTVNGTARQVLAANPTRAYARCGNFSSNSISVYLGLSNTASNSWGILVPASSSYDILANQNLYRGAIWAKTGGGNGRVSCVER